MDPVTGAILGSSIQGLSSLGSGLFGYLSTKATNKANRQLAELAYQQNIEQWHRENAYNHPAEQMARLQEAGLNPNLVYGNGSAVQTSARSPQMEYPQMQVPNIHAQLPNFFDEILNAKLKVAEIQNVESATDKNNAEAGLARANGIIQGYMATMKKFDSEHQQELFDNTMKELKGRIALQGWQIKEYESLQSERDERKRQVERLNQFWDSHPNMYWLKGIMETLQPVVPGIMSIVENMIFKRRGKFGSVKRGPDGQVIYSFEDLYR